MINIPLTSTISPGTSSVAGRMEKQPVTIDGQEVVRNPTYLGNQMYNLLTLRPTDGKKHIVWA